MPVPGAATDALDRSDSQTAKGVPEAVPLTV